MIQTEYLLLHSAQDALIRQILDAGSTIVQCGVITTPEPPSLESIDDMRRAMKDRAYTYLLMHQDYTKEPVYVAQVAPFDDGRPCYIVSQCRGGPGIILEPCMWRHGEGARTATGRIAYCSSYELDGEYVDPGRELKVYYKKFVGMLNAMTIRVRNKPTRHTIRLDKAIPIEDVTAIVGHGPWER